MAYPACKPLLKVAKKIIDKLPKENKIVLDRILSLIRNVVKHQPQNKMTFENLAVVMGTNILRPVETVSPQEVAQAIPCKI